MARYDITSLNYINVGTNRVFFNFDSQITYTLKKDINRLRDEEDTTLIGFKSLEKYLVTEDDRELVRDHDNIFLIDKPILIDDGNVSYDIDNYTIKVTLSNDNEIFDNSILKFNRNRITINNTFVSDFFQKDNKNIFNVSGIQYTPMYNMIDMSIKSSYDIFYRNTEVDAEDTYTNVYAPDISSNPIQFCQINYGSVGNTFMLTPSTKYDVYKLESSLLLNRNKNGSYPIDTYLTYHDMQLTKNKYEILTYTNLYTTGCDSYGEYLSTQNINPVEIFEPKKSIINTNRNYILKFPISDIVTDYNTGNINAEIFPCKNHLNSMYEMELTNNDLKHGRDYCGINSSGNVVYLKYYDNCDYNLTKTNRQNGIDIIDAVSNHKEKVVPYQKVESFYKTSFTNKRRHKSNLFSIKISDLGDLSEVTDKNDELRDKVRHDLQSAINDIVNNICPVNTQLFKVYFGMQ